MKEQMNVRLRKVLPNILLIVFSTVLSLGIAEVFVRLTFPPPEIVHVELDRNKKGEAGRMALLNNLITFPDFEGRGLHRFTPLGKRMNPNVVVTIRDSAYTNQTITYRTNCLGFRNRELGEKKGKRILFIGDSITFGFKINEKDGFVRLIENLAKKDHLPLETINAGIQGTAFQNYLSVLMESGLSTNPDMVVLGVYLNDYEPSPGIRIIPVPSLMKGSWFFHYLFNTLSRIRYEYEKDSLLSYETDPMKMAEWRMEVVKRYPGGKGDPLKSRRAFNALLHTNDYGIAWNEKAWNELIPAFREFKRQSVIHKFKLLMVIFPIDKQVSAQFNADYPQRILKGIAHKQTIPVIDVLPLLRAEHARGGERLFFDQCHYTPYGNRILARAIYKFIRKHLQK